MTEGKAVLAEVPQIELLNRLRSAVDIRLLAVEFWLGSDSQEFKDGWRNQKAEDDRTDEKFAAAATKAMSDLVGSLVSKELQGPCQKHEIKLQSTSFADGVTDVEGLASLQS